MMLSPTPKLHLMPLLSKILRRISLKRRPNPRWRTVFLTNNKLLPKPRSLSKKKLKKSDRILKLQSITSLLNKFRRKSHQKKKITNP